MAECDPGPVSRVDGGRAVRNSRSPSSANPQQTAFLLTKRLYLLLDIRLQVFEADQDKKETCLNIDGKEKGVVNVVKVGENGVVGWVISICFQPSLLGTRLNCWAACMH